MNNSSIQSSLDQATDKGCSVSRLSGVNMCDKCLELDGKIEHYHRMASLITDRPTVDAIKELIARMMAQKAALHPEAEE
jgi:hypothetical protein